MSRAFVHECDNTGSRIGVATGTEHVAIAIDDGSEHGRVVHMLNNRAIPELIEVLQSALAEKEDGT